MEFSGDLRLLRTLNHFKFPLMTQLEVYFSQTHDINMVGNHFDSVAHSFCDDWKSSVVKTSLNKFSMPACAFLCSVGGKVMACGSLEPLKQNDM